MRKKILINTYYFYPDITPRAFRAFELAKEFARQGHDVTVLLPKSDYDYRDVCQKYNFSVDFVAYSKAIESANTPAMAAEPTIVKKILRYALRIPTYCLFPSGRSLKFYFYAVYRKLKKEQQAYDMVLSIAFPFDTHIGAAMAFGANKQFVSTAKIADYGDPLYKNPTLPACPLYFWIDRFIASRFDYITIPTEKALSVYSSFKSEEQIKIIPQGFDFSEIRKSNYQKNAVPTFAYAGTFYEDIRNPTVLLENLYKLHQKGMDFRFMIYTKTGNPNNMKLINNYISLLGDKLVIHNMIPREDAIYELSKMDFLINLENLSESQAPSKLIDYGLTGRPIYSFDQLNFSEETLIKFFNADYTLATATDLEPFDIKNVADHFLKMSTGAKK
ncbi:MAG: glycosyltransferase [Sulfurovum sp.]|nr:glycosyltransferase [Sulfurovum sp.]